MRAKPASLVRAEEAQEKTPALPRRQIRTPGKTKAPAEAREATEMAEAAEAAEEACGPVLRWQRELR